MPGPRDDRPEKVARLTALIEALWQEPVAADVCGRLLCAQYGMLIAVAGVDAARDGLNRLVVMREHIEAGAARIKELHGVLGIDMLS